MKLEQFYKLTYLIVAVGVVIAAALGLVSEFKLPAVTGVEVRGDMNAAAYVDQQIKLSFNRPIDWDGVQDKITISPQVPFTTYAAGSTLSIVVNGVLQPETTHSLTIGGQLRDVYGNAMHNDYNLEFTTKPRRLAFISRSSGKGDQVITANDELQDLETLFTGDHVTLFDITTEWLAVVSADESGTSTLTVKELGTSREKILEEPGNARISALDASVQLQKLIYTIQPVEVVNGVAIAQDVHELKIYDFFTGQTRTFEPPFEVIDYVDVRFTDDGLGLIIREGQGTYYLMDFENPELNVSLGKHIAMSNFSRNGDKVIFTDQPIGQTYSSYPSIAISDDQRNLTELQDGTDFWIDLQFMNTSDDIILAEYFKEFIGSKGIFRIMLFNSKSGGTEELLKAENMHSLELPVPSPDDELLVIERYNQEDLVNYENLRNIEFQTKPADADLLIYNIAQNRLVDTGLRGVSAVWL